MNGHGTDRPGLMLINLGTPDSPKPSDVRRYLREFLSDARVIDLPAWKRKLVLELFILPFRPKASGEAYEKIWTDRGSPLLFHTEDLATAVRERLGEDVVVEIAMRYGEPSIPGALERFRRQGVRRIVAFPLYPQYSAAATASSLDHVFRSACAGWDVPYLHVVPPFYDQPGYIRESAALAKPRYEQARPERVFFSFHGLPERQIRKSDPTGSHCLSSSDCCRRPSPAHGACYRAQCYENARLLADAIGVPEEERVVCFQSRLGRDPWIRPYTDELIVEAAKSGVRRAMILSPAFVADCLETLEELGMRAVEDFRAAGGEHLEVVPCLNARPAWADVVVELARSASAWLEREPATARGAAP